MNTRLFARFAALLLMVGAVGCGGGGAVKEPAKFAPLPDKLTMTDKDGKLKPLGGSSATEISAPAKR